MFLGTLTDVVTGGGELAGEVGVMAQLDVETPQGEGTADGLSLIHISSETMVDLAAMTRRSDSMQAGSSASTSQM